MCNEATNRCEEVHSRGGTWRASTCPAPLVRPARASLRVAVGADGREAHEELEGDLRPGNVNLHVAVRTQASLFHTLGSAHCSHVQHIRQGMMHAVSSVHAASSPWKTNPGTMLTDAGATGSTAGTAQHYDVFVQVPTPRSKAACWYSDEMLDETTVAKPPNQKNGARLTNTAEPDMLTWGVAWGQRVSSHCTILPAHRGWVSGQCHRVGGHGTRTVWQMQ